MKLLRVREVCELTGLSRKQLFDYRHIVAPTGYENAAGYKLYDEESVERLKQIALLRELEVPLKEIQAFLEDPTETGSRILARQIERIKRQQERHSDVLLVAEYVQSVGADHMQKILEIGFDVDRIAGYLKQNKE